MGQGLAPGVHTDPQTWFSQVATLFDGAGHWVQLGPHALGPSNAQLPPHMTAPALHAAPQVPLVHVAVPLAGAGHGVHDVPHVAGLSLDAQVPPQTW